MTGLTIGGSARVGYPNMCLSLIPTDRRRPSLSAFRIAVEIGHQKPKFLLVGDVAYSRLNYTAHTIGIYWPQGLESFIALSRLRAPRGGTDLRAWAAVSHHAYRTISPHPESAAASCICFTNPDGQFPYKSRNHLAADGAG